MDERFTSILRNHLTHLEPGQELAPDAPLRDLGLDSLRAVALILEVEETFDITLPDASLTARTFETPWLLWSAIRETTRSP